MERTAELAFVSGGNLGSVVDGPSVAAYLQAMDALLGATQGEVV